MNYKCKSPILFHLWNRIDVVKKTFIQQEDAHKWARETETQIEKGLYEDLSQANSIT